VICIYTTAIKKNVVPASVTHAILRFGVAEVPPKTATIAAGRLRRFVTVPVLLFDARMNAADPGSETLLGKSESTFNDASVPPGVTPAATPRVARIALAAPEIEPPELTDKLM
jgi:hypothetical protein